MLKKRIIPVQLLLKDRLVKTVRFGDYRDVGNPVSSSKVYCDQDADELVFLNINRSERRIEELVQLLRKVSEVCFMPLTAGGGITTYEGVEILIRNGADKIVLNTAAYSDTVLIRRIANTYGSQAVVVSIDASWNQDKSDYTLYSDCGRLAHATPLEEHVDKVIAAGAGELFINSIDRDGTMKGYDLELIRRVCKKSNIPVIACGGAGNFEHLREAFVETGVQALACGSLFNFGDNNPIRAKAYLTNYNIPFKLL